LGEMNAINHFIGMYHIVPGVNEDKTRQFPVYYVFDTKKDARDRKLLILKQMNPFVLTLPQKH